MNKEKNSKHNSRKAEHRRGMSKGQIRAERRERSQSKKKRKRFMIYSVVILIAILLILSLVLPSFSQRNTQKSISRDPQPFNASGPTPALEDMGSQVIPVGSSHVPYSTKPATSGPYWYIKPDVEDLAKEGAPIKWGIYDKEIADEILIHNLIRGGIGIHYNCPDGCKTLVKKLKDIIPGNKSQFVMSPYSGMPSKIAITSWRHLMYLDEFDSERIKEFITSYQDRAPQSIPGNYWPAN